MRHLFNTHIRTFLLSAFMVCSLASYAQQLHFIYIQSDDKQPFSVALGGKYYSSSSIGYIILPKLTDGSYTFTVNFAKNSYPEQTFAVNVNGKDYGYALKNFGDKGWGLFNYQTTDVIMNSTASAQQSSTSQPNSVTNTSAFGNMLADAVNDKSINTLSPADTVTTAKTTKTDRKQPISVAAPADTNAATDVTNTVVQNKNKSSEVSVDTSALEDSSAQASDFNTSGVIKAEENVGEKGTDLTFIDFNGDHSDTIKAFIPATADSQAVDKEETTANVGANAAAADTVKGKVNNPFFNNGDSTSGTVNTKSDVTEDNGAGSSAPTSTAMVNSACTNMVSDGDLNKLKKRIVSQTDQNEILQTVKKSLKNRCITTAQVKDLGNLFLSDDNRYGFYDAVYPFVYDYGNYATLQSTLVDPNYKSRFKALLH